MKLGVLGGTFDPIHLGHVALAEAAIRCAGLDELLLVPANVPPHKSAATAPAADRLEMCRLASAGEAGLRVSDVEVRRPGPSYTADTLRELAGPDTELHLVLGWDAAGLLPSWRQPEVVVALARLVIFPRPGVPGPAPADLRRVGIDPARAVICAEATPEVDATEIRARAAAGESLEGLVPAAVAGYIAERGLYRGDNAAID